MKLPQIYSRSKEGLDHSRNPRNDRSCHRGPGPRIIRFLWKRTQYIIPRGRDIHRERPEITEPRHLFLTGRIPITRRSYTNTQRFRVVARTHGFVVIVTAVVRGSRDEQLAELRGSH